MSPDTPLRGLPCAVIDFEATGLPHDDPHVVDVAVVHVTLDSKAEEPDARVAFASRVRPPVPIPESASRIHGITDADVVDAPRWAEVADRVLAACEGRVVVAYNAPADFLFLRAEQQRIGGFLPPWPWLDLLVVRKATVTRGTPGKLAEIARAHGVVLDAHGATGDALTTALLLGPLMREAALGGAFTSSGGARALYDRRRSWDYDDEDDAPSPPKVSTLGAILAWQRGAALYQEVEFSAYALRQGWARRPSADWHAIEGVEPPPWPTGPATAPCPKCRAAVVRRVGRDGGTYLATPDGAEHRCAP